jgi:hypothetical protein
LDDYYQERHRPIAGKRDFDRILGDAAALENAARMPNEFDSIRLFLRTIAHQQFPYQRGLFSSDFARQFVLFGRLQGNHRLSVAFEEKFGIPVRRFLLLSIATLPLLVKDEPTPVSTGWFASLYKGVSDEEIGRFLAAISVTLDEGRDFMLSLDDRKRPSSEFYEQSPFIRKPLLRMPTGYWPIHLALLHRGLENFVYDNLRAVDPQGFMDSFSKIFENYVGTVVRAAPGDVYTERELIKARKQRGKVVDFAIFCADSIVLVDAKAVSGTHESQTASSARALRDRTKSGALKAVEQALGLLLDLDAGHLALPRERGSNEEFRALIVVTAREMHLGNGVSFSEAVGHDELEKIYAKYQGNDRLPKEHIYFMSIEAFEHLMGAVSQNETSLRKAIERARDDDAVPSSAKFDFNQHLATQGLAFELPAAIEQELDMALHELEGMLEQGASE